MDDERIIKLAMRGEIAPESLTIEEIRELGMVVLCDLNDAGEHLCAELPNQN